MNVHLSTFWARHPALVAGLKTVLMTSTGLELGVALLVIKLGLHLTTPMEQAKVNGTVPRYIMKEAEESCHGSCLGLKSSFSYSNTMPFCVWIEIVWISIHFGAEMSTFSMWLNEVLFKQKGLTDSSKYATFSTGLIETLRNLEMYVMDTHTHMHTLPAIQGLNCWLVLVLFPVVRGSGASFVSQALSRAKWRRQDGRVV